MQKNKFIVIFDHSNGQSHEVFPKKKEAVSFSEYGSSTEVITDIGIISISKKRLVQHNKLIGKKEAERRAGLFIFKNPNLFRKTKT